MLRSPHAHARIKSIDVEAARQLPGVVAVISGADIAGVLDDLPTRAMEGEWQARPCMPPSSLSGPGQGLLCRTASGRRGSQDRYGARDAVDLIQVDYEPLPPIVDPWKRHERTNHPQPIGSNIALRIRHDRQGADLDAAFAQADRIIRQRYEVQRLAPVPLETRGLVAHYQPQENLLTIWAPLPKDHTEYADN